MKPENKLELIQEIRTKTAALFKSGLIRKGSRAFTAVNLGNCFIKGVTVKNGCLDGYFLEEQKPLPQVISYLKKHNKILGRKVRVSLKNPSCLVRYFPFSKIDKKELRQALYYQLNKIIPYSPEDVYFDYTVLKENSPSEVYILLAAVKKGYIDKIIEAFREEGLSISQITLDSISLLNLYQDRYPQDSGINSCILDIGYSFSAINILQKGVPFLTREAKFSTKDIIEVASRIKNTSKEKIAGALPKLGKKSSLSGIVEENICDWCKEIKNSFDFFELNKGEKINKLYLTGGFVSTPGIAENFADNLEVDTEILIPDKPGTLEFADEFPFKEYRSYRHNLAVSLGLIL